MEAALDALTEIHHDYVCRYYVAPLVGDIYRMPPFQEAIFAVFRESGDLDVDLDGRSSGCAMC